MVTSGPPVVDSGERKCPDTAPPPEPRNGIAGDCRPLEEPLNVQKTKVKLEPPVLDMTMYAEYSPAEVGSPMAL